jgi:hypothetical protein
MSATIECCWRRGTSRGVCLGTCCEASRHSDQLDRRAVDRNRFRSRARLKKGRCLRNGWEKRQFLASRFCHGCRKASALNNLVGASHTNWVEYTLSVGREVKTGILVDRWAGCHSAPHLGRSGYANRNVSRMLTWASLYSCLFFSASANFHPRLA